MAATHIYTEALWSSTIEKPVPMRTMTGDIETDVLIVGAGITGISTAYNLSREGLKVVVVDSGEVGMGSTGASTGNLYVPHGKFHTILSKHGEDALKSVASARQTALNFIESRIMEYSIDCGFKRVPWYYFATKRAGSGEIEKEYEAIKTAGVAASNSVSETFPFSIESIAVVENQAQFNPLQYVKKLAAAIENENCRIFENTRVTDIKDGDPCVVETVGGTIRAKKVVQATHTPKGIYEVHALMEVYREYAIAVRLHDKLPGEGIYWATEGKSKYSVRTYNDGNATYLIVLDDTHKTGHMEETEKSFEKLKNYISEHFQAEEISYRWAAQNYSPADYLPYIGTSPLQKNVYIATGFSADGLIYGTVASIIISNLISGKPDQWAKTFDPKRFNPLKSAKNAIRENVDVGINLIRDHFKGNEKLLFNIQKGEGKILEVNKVRSAVYLDESNEYHIVSPVCPHLGCIVHWNNGEKSWDCPCHGSRFSVDGKLLEGPAFKDLEK